MKRKVNVLAEVELNMLNYNLIRTLSIIGPEELRSRLNVLFSVFLSIIYRLLTTLRQPLTQSELKYRLAAQFLRGKTQQQLTLS